MNPNHVLAKDVRTTTVEGQYVLEYHPTPLGSPGAIYFRTELQSGYQIQGREGYYLLGTVSQRKSNLNIVTITLVGADGVVYAHDSFDSNAVMRTMSKLEAASTVNYESIGTIYVAN